jgi:hypothetical protein
MPLTDTQVRQARPKEKVYKLRDERGLLLLVRPTGAKWWRLRYKFQGKENMPSLGVYPDVSLSMARDRRDVARRSIADGKDPRWSHRWLGLWHPPESARLPGHIEELPEVRPVDELAPRLLLAIGCPVSRV